MSGTWQRLACPKRSLSAVVRPEPASPDRFRVTYRHRCRQGRSARRLSYFNQSGRWAAFFMRCILSFAARTTIYRSPPRLIWLGEPLWKACAGILLFPDAANCA